MSEIKIGKMTIGIAMTNTYFIYKEGSKDAIVIDPADRGELIYDKLNEKGFDVKAILLTHGHFDHIWGVEKLKEKSGAIVYASLLEKDFLANPDANMSAHYDRPCKLIPDIFLKDDEEFEVANISIKMLSTPGHTLGGCCYYIKEAGFLISGDTLFLESVGRTDFKGGSMSTLVRSINDKLLVLPDETKVYPGHGEPTTIAYEREYNPFL